MLVVRHIFVNHFRPLPHKEQGFALQPTIQWSLEYSTKPRSKKKPCTRQGFYIKTGYLLGKQHFFGLGKSRAFQAVEIDPAAH